MIGDDEFSDQGEPAGEAAADGAGEAAVNTNDIAEIERRYEEARDAWFRLRGSDPEGE